MSVERLLRWLMGAGKDESDPNQDSDQDEYIKSWQPKWLLRLELELGYWLQFRRNESMAIVGACFGLLLLAAFLYDL